MIKKGFHVAGAETHPHESDLASELRICIIDKCFNIIAIKTAGNSCEIEFLR